MSTVIGFSTDFFILLIAIHRFGQVFQFTEFGMLSSLWDRVLGVIMAF